MLRTSAQTRVLNDADVPAAREVLARDPVANVFVASRMEAAGLDHWRTGVEVWGYFSDRRLTALCFAGANLVPACADQEAIAAFADRARKQGRRCSSLVGPAEMVLGLWAQLAGTWGSPREIRPDQPLLVLRHPPRVPIDPLVRRVRPDEIDTLFPSSIAMFTEEVGVSPTAGDGGALYHARVQELVSTGRAFARIDEGEVLFKAEIGAATAAACQVQGVWVRPDQRGKGLGTAATAAVAAVALAEIAPAVSLYVNSFNQPARAAYRKIGFDQEGTFASVLF